MIKISDLERIDSQKMYSIYDNWPKIAKKQFETDFKVLEYEKTNHIVFAGMGGSGALGDVFSSILSKTNIHVDVIKGYNLPNTVDSKTLIVTTSISGNTDEVINVLNSAKKLGSRIIAFSSGGKMMKLCYEKNLEHRKIALNHSPRASFVTYLFSMLKILENILPVKNEDVNQSIRELFNLNKKISSSNLSNSNPALNLAEWITEIPLIYYPSGLQAAAIRFKNSLQENAKLHVITEDVIEACHNGIVSWENPSLVKPILLQGEDDFFKTKERWMVLKEFFNYKDIEYRDIKSINGGILSKLIYLIYLLDYTSIYKAVLNQIDPTPVKPIDFIKKKL